MTGNARYELMSVDALGPAEWAAWGGFVQASPALASPFFSARYAQVAGSLAPGACVAVVHRGGRIEAFQPVQRRGPMLQPLGAPLTDYHGPIAQPGATVEPGLLLRALGARRFSFTGLTAPTAHGDWHARTTVTAAMPDGFDAYLSERRLRFPKYYRDKERSARALARDHGEVAYDFDDQSGYAFEWLIARKREQYREGGQPDVFACGWTTELLRTLRSERGGGVEGRLATLRVDGRLIAAEYSLRAGDRDHLWIPAFDCEHRRYSPGVLLTLALMRAAALEGVRHTDFGVDEEPYKRHFADPSGVVFEGAFPTETSTRAAAFLQRHAPPIGPAVARLNRKAARRWQVIRACEPGWPAAASAAANGAVNVLKRRLQQA